MSKVPSNIAVGLDLGRVDWSPRERLMLGRIDNGVKSANRRARLIGDILNKEVSAGYPEDETGVPVSQNIRGGWARAVLTNANQLANGAGAPVVFTHNLNLPLVLVTGRAYNHFNVYPVVVRAIYGDRSGTNAAPAAPAAAAGPTSLLLLLGDAVTANTVAVRVYSGLTIGATTPLTLDVFWAPCLK